MESLQLFTMLLLGVCAVHLLFSSVAMLRRWLGKGGQASATASHGKKFDHSGWYVFFDPADLYGRSSKPGRAEPPRKNEQRGQDRRSRKRTGARLAA